MGFFGLIGFRVSGDLEVLVYDDLQRVVSGFGGVGLIIDIPEGVACDFVRRFHNSVVLFLRACLRVLEGF